MRKVPGMPKRQGNTGNVVPTCFVQSWQKACWSQPHFKSKLYKATPGGTPCLC